MLSALSSRSGEKIKSILTVKDDEQLQTKIKVRSGTTKVTVPTEPQNSVLVVKTYRLTQYAIHATRHIRPYYSQNILIIFIIFSHSAARVHSVVYQY